MRDGADESSLRNLLLDAQHMPNCMGESRGSRSPEEGEGAFSEVEWDRHLPWVRRRPAGN